MHHTEQWAAEVAAAAVHARVVKTEHVRSHGRHARNVVTLWEHLYAVNGVELPLNVVDDVMERFKTRKAALDATPRKVDEFRAALGSFAFEAFDHPDTSYVTAVKAGAPAGGSS